MAEQREFYWNRLENAAKIFPAVRSADNSSVYRVAVKLTEPIQPEVLRAAVEKALLELPAFHVKLRRGFFWYYWESNDLKPLVREDLNYPLRPMDKRQNNGFFFRTTYFGKKINLELFHALTDGAGAMVLLKSIIYHYLKAIHPESITKNELIAETGFSQHALQEDAYRRLKSGEAVKPARQKTIPAYQLRGERYLTGRIDVTQGILPVSEIVPLCKALGVTVTAYLTALLIYAMYETNYKYYKENKPIVVSVPVNLRGFLESSTVRNFFSFITVSIHFFGQSYTFQDVLQSVSSQLKNALDERSLFERLAYNMRAERNLALRFMPLFFKNLVLRGIYTRGERGYTSTLSNLGQIRLPEEQRPFVDRFESLNNITKRQCFKVCMCSCGDKMTISFVSGMLEKDVERYFFRYLAERGVTVHLASNEVREE